MNDDESNGRMSPASQRYHARHGLTEHQRFEPCCVSDSSPRLNNTVLVSPSPPTAIPRQLRRLPLQEDGDPNFQEEARNEDEDYHKRQRHQRRSRTPSPSSLGYRNSDESNRKKRRRLHFHESSACLNEKDESEDCQPVTIRQKKGSTQSRGRHAELVSHKTSALDLDDTSYGPLPRPDTYQVREGHPLVNPTTERHPLKKVTCSIEQLDDAERQDTMNLNVSLDKFCGQLDAPITESYNRPRAFFHFQQSAQSPKNINGLPPPEFHHDKLTRDKYLALRVRQRRLYADVEGDCRSPDEPTLHFLSHKQYRNNHYFHHAVVRAREGFLDAQNLYVIADKTANFVAKMQARNRFDEDRFVNSLWGKCVQQTFKKGRCFDWGFLGREASICFNAVPSNVRFLSGDIDAPKEAKSRQARSRTVVPEDKILVVNVETASERTHLSKRQGEHPHKEILSTMKRRLKERCAEMYNTNRIKAESINDSHSLAKAKLHGSEIDGIQFLINPNSFTQSVENIFNFSYLVKQGQSEIGVRPCGGDFEIQGLYVKKRHGKVVADLPCRQAVCKFSMRDWRWLCQTYGHKKGDLPHRCSPFTRAP